MFQEENRNNKNIKNDKQWKKRVNLFRLVYSFLETNNTDIEIVDNLEEDDVVGENFKDQRKILKNVIENLESYKELISKHLKNWSFERISDVDKALFLSALGEYNVLKTNKNIIIDQTIITAKRYSSPIAYKYINAVLDKILE